MKEGITEGKKEKAN
jgi:hypothetical protein